MQSPSPLTVLYITGWCRSGSTLIGNILNELDGAFHAGELFYFWRNISRGGTNTICGCGEQLDACPVWTEVAPVVSKPDDTSDFAAKVLKAQPAVRTRHTWRILKGQQSQALSFYQSVLARSYAAIAGVTGASLIIDGGKYPAEAALAARIEGIDLRILHLVRDPRAVAHSWSREKAYIPSMSTLRSTAYWVGFNMASDALRARYPKRSMLLRYEDFIKDPEQALSRIVDLVGRPPDDLPIDGRTVVLGTNHTVTGNPDRLQRGAVTIKAQDTSWRQSLSMSRRLTADFLAFPNAMRYGYPSL